MIKKSRNKLPKTPLLAVDCVVIDKNKNVLLVRRKYNPFKGFNALPGGFVEIGESVEDACFRELKEETGIILKDLKLVGIYSNPNRDPRGHVCSVAFMCLTDQKVSKAGDDAVEALWTKSWRKKGLAFDHKNIISDAFSTLRK